VSDFMDLDQVTVMCVGTVAKVTSTTRCGLFNYIFPGKITGYVHV
jgi:hypothetical protein